MDLKTLARRLRGRLAVSGVGWSNIHEVVVIVCGKACDCLKNVAWLLLSPLITKELPHRLANPAVVPLKFLYCCYL